MKTYFDTATVQQRMQVPEWCERLGQKLYPIDLKPQALTNFSARIGEMRLGALDLFELNVDPVSVSKGRSCTPAAVESNVFVSLLRRGRTELKRDNISLVQMPRDIVIWQRTPATIWGHPNHQIRSIVLKISGNLAESEIAGACHQRPRLLRAASPAAALLNNLVDEVITMRDVSANSRLANTTSQCILDILRAGLAADECSSVEGERRARHVDHAKNYLRSRLGDAELTVEDAASALDMSARTLNRLFAQEGETVMKWLQKQRLKSGFAILSRGGQVKIADVALDCGFVNFSHFSSAFRKAYGVTPRELASR
ncbi:AraC family transcriptional regulator [Variovorax sp. J31P207]|uniref:AraC family transcriptional regulator n=1 Tax=Variovorax sp. J31P207 TaxID=3053510 RepID=UPI002576EE85|nr:AraC family transcriptional regulator [Variovorax sp. J31P207]MDM0069943.1 AraC family transcriptional regulator [Variovorax sp. J31P207]